MVNAAAAHTDERRERDRGSASAHAFGAAKLNPFGDLHTLQHLSARLARMLKGVWEPILRREVRSWAEPLMVQRFADYRAERPDQLTAWLPLAMSGAGHSGAALVVFNGRWVLEVLDLFFGGSGHAPAHMPAEFSPAAEAMVARLGASLCPPLKSAWEPLTRVDFQPGRMEGSPTLLGGFDADEAAVVTRFGLAGAGGAPVFVDILYSIAALKPHAATLTGRVLDKAEPDPAWRQGLTRSVMTVSCATPPPPSAPPPRLVLPQAATTPCRLDRLPEAATIADLEASYAARGAALVLCDAARSLAVDTLTAERALQDHPRRVSRGPWWRTRP